jgi:hypothetical protein
MSGRKLILWFLFALAVFTVALVYYQFFAYYHRDRESTEIVVGGERYAVAALDLIDADTSPLKLRACFRADPATFAGLPMAEKATPLTPPPWFDCFDTRQIAADLAAGRAVPHLLAAGEPEGTDTIAAIYPDGRGYLWRQLEAGFGD